MSGPLIVKRLAEDYRMQHRDHFLKNIVPISSACVEIMKRSASVGVRAVCIEDLVDVLKNGNTNLLNVPEDAGKLLQENPERIVDMLKADGFKFNENGYIVFEEQGE